MAMQPSHNRLVFDCRPTKAEAREVLDKFERGELVAAHAGKQLLALSHGVPNALSHLLTTVAVTCSMRDQGAPQARRLLDSFADWVFQTRALPLVNWVGRLLKLGALALLIRLIVSLVT